MERSAALFTDVLLAVDSQDLRYMQAAQSALPEVRLRQLLTFDNEQLRRSLDTYYKESLIGRGNRMGRLYAEHIVTTGGFMVRLTTPAAERGFIPRPARLFYRRHELYRLGWAEDRPLAGVSSRAADLR